MKSYICMCTHKHKYILPSQIQRSTFSFQLYTPHPLLCVLCLSSAISIVTLFWFPPETLWNAGHSVGKPKITLVLFPLLRAACSGCSDGHPVLQQASTVAQLSRLNIDWLFSSSLHPPSFAISSSFFPFSILLCTRHREKKKKKKNAFRIS